jgi:hypothetical protein
MTLPPALRNRTGNDDGFALLTVLGSMVVITMFLLSTLAYALNNAQPSRNDQDGKAALAAAQAGIDEYISRLTADDTYFDNNGVDPANPAFDGDGDGFGVAVPGTDGQAASFRYQQLNTAADIGTFGIIRLRVTGTSRTENRDLTAEISPDGFLKYIYFTDLESADPRMWRNGVHAKRGTTTLVDDAAGTLTGTPYRPYAKVSGTGSIEYYILTWTASPLKYDELCSTYWHAGRNAPVYTSGKYYEYAQGYDKFNKKKGALSGPTEHNASTTTPVGFKCREVQFGAGDEINGPLHSNDSLQIAGAVVFKDERTESSWDVDSPTNTATPHPSGLWWGTSAPSDTGYEPVFAPKVAMPTSNTELVALAQPAAPDSPDRGCLYTGDTRITFFVDASGAGKMRVLSPLTSSSVPRCYNTATPGTEQILDIPPVVYVQDATTGTCAIGAVGYPKTGEIWGNDFTTRYDCKKGNAFVSGSLSGRVTVATSNDIVIVGDTTHAGGMAGTDALGLIPTNYAWVYHPVDSAGENLLPYSAAVRNIDAAILAVKRSFLAQNFYKGDILSTNNNEDDGTKLKVRGAIAQKHRGPVGTPGGGGFDPAGYIKLYQYDQRLKFSPPPFFLRPEDAPWRVTKVTD